MKARSLGIAVLAFFAFTAFTLANEFCWSDSSSETRAAVSHVVSHVAETEAVVEVESRREFKDIVIDKTFAVKPGEMLEVRNAHSDVVIETGSGSEARVRVTLSGRNIDRARAFFEHLNFSVEKSGRMLSVVTDPKGRWNGDSGGADIDVRITIPEVFDADVRSRHGDVHVGDLKGELSFDVAHGDLQTGTFSGSLLTIATAHGDLEAQRFASEKIRVDVQHGDADVDAVTAMVIEFEAQHGDVEIEDVTASEITIATVHGDITIDRLDGYPRISAQHGDIDVFLANARGGEFSGQHSDMDLAVESSAGLNLDFTASEIEIESSHQFQGRQERDRLDGRINGGGPKLAVKSTHGEIRLRAN